MSYWSQSAYSLETSADRLTARIIDENIQGPERERMLERHATYLRMAQEHWDWHYEFAADADEKEIEE